MQITHAHAVLIQIIGEVFRHTLGERGDQHAFADLHALVLFGQEIVHLRDRGPYDDLWIDQSGRPHDLLGNLIGVRALVVGGRRRDEDALRTPRLEFLKFERAVVHRRGQAEAVIDQVLLARAVALVHRAPLRNRDMAFIDVHRRVGRQVISQGRRRLAGRAAGEVARVIFDAGTMAELHQHFNIELGAFFETLRLHQFIRLAQLRQTLGEFGLDALDRFQHFVARRHVVALRVDRDARQLARDLAGQRVEHTDALDLLVEQLDAHGLGLRLRREDVDDLAAHAIGRAPQFDVVAGVLQLGEAAQHVALVHHVTARQVQHHAVIGLGITEAVDAGHGRDDDDVAPLHQRLGSREPHLLDVLVDRGVLLYVSVRRRHVGLGLVVVVIRNEIFHGVIGEELAHLAVELGRQGLVGRQDQRRALDLLDYVGDGVGLARAGHAQQGLACETIVEALHQGADGVGLVAGGGELGGDFKTFAHGGYSEKRHSSIVRILLGPEIGKKLDVQLSTRVQRIKPSPTLAITARAAALRAAGKDIIGLGAGEPEIATPDHIKQAAIRAIETGFTKSTDVAGTAELRRAVIAKFARENSLEYKLNQVLISVGGKQSFFNLVQALLNPGDEVIIPSPYWVSYPDMVLLADGIPVVIYAGIEQEFKITPAQLEAAITPMTRLVVINSPSNPTGVAYTREELAALGEVLRRHPKVLIATDDMYEHILWTAEPFVNILNACPDLY